MHFSQKPYILFLLFPTPTPKSKIRPFQNFPKVSLFTPTSLKFIESVFFSQINLNQEYFKTNYLLLQMSVKVNQASSRLPPCHFVIRFQNYKPSINSNNQPSQRAYPSRIPFLQQGCSLPFTQTADVFKTASPKISASDATLVFPLLSLPEKALEPYIEQRLQDPPNTTIKTEQANSQNIQLTHSLIQDLLFLDESIALDSAPLQKKKGLQQLDILQTQSWQQQNSGYFDDQHSEAVALTEEEKHFFNNFIVEEDCSRQLDQSIIKNARLLENCSAFSLKSNHILHQKKRVIRNFFRPKSSFLKDQKTSCNSYKNLDQIIDSSKRVSALSQQKCSIQHKEQNSSTSKLISYNN